ncbi:TRAP transporter large permease subunit [Chelativorans sp. SCAU2101]|uniref:TRAP transporter large permease subunit n=1 Tax=Chelativorans petroleitrophicus TaxID=2975484 RepID=A0A9X2XB84_9HYPH|nr:TRAP transporter large permease subunit [Chelativorans petroleitrophicus]MCT8991974.1 TRAP transporter large permease subunit [Chelativorans petroleitrophicus]
MGMSYADSDATPAGVASEKTLTGVAGVLDRILETICVALLVVAISVSLLQVTMRYGFHAALPWPEELAVWAFAWATFLGMALATGREAHIRIDILANRLPAGVQRWHPPAVNAVIAAASFMLVVHGTEYVMRAIQVSPALQWPMRWFFLAVPVGGALNLLFLLLPRSDRSLAQSVSAVILGLAIYLAVRHGAGYVFDQKDSGAVLLITALILVCLGVPIAFAMAFGTFAAFAPLANILLVTVSQNMAASLNSFTLLAIPFFILAAAVMNAGGITPRLIELATKLVGHFRGGLGQANVVTNTLLAGVSGSSTADASTVAKLMVPEMAERGYSRPFGAALTASGATIANLIPPSLGLIIYGSLASVSVGALFVATIVPGLLVAAGLISTVYVISRRRGFGGDLPKASLPDRMSSFFVAIPALILPLLIVGGVRFGVFTATEAGAAAFAYALVCGFLFYRKLTPGNLLAAIRESVMDTVVIVVIIAAAAPFAWVLAFEQVPQKIARSFALLSDSPIILMLIVNLFLLVVGLFMEMIASLIILVPILVPIVTAAGVDPIHFGIVIVMNLVIGALTPPLGVLIFTTARVSRANLNETFKAVVPFVLVLVFVLMLVTYVPAFSLVPLEWLGP